MWDHISGVDQALAEIDGLAAKERREKEISRLIKQNTAHGANRKVNGSGKNGQ